ncbi:MAG: hypothetical protein LBE49_01155 [Deltaproteobacteria bacterium]|jgi:hypothetical protein|nr:hypothetical protein [Deltaproteobacteria bacterium]
MTRRNRKKSSEYQPMPKGPLEISAKVAEAMSRGRHIEAVELISDFPRRARSYNMIKNLARCLSAMGLQEVARAELDAAKGLSDQDPEWGLIQGLTYFREQNYTQAFSCLASIRGGLKAFCLKDPLPAGEEFEDLLAMCRGKLNEQWTRRRQPGYGIWDLRLDIDSLPFEYVDEDKAIPAEDRPLLSGMPGVRAAALERVCFEPASKDNWWRGDMIPPFGAALCCLKDGKAVFKLTMSLDSSEEPALALFSRLERMGLVSDAYTWRSLLSSRILAVRRKLFDRLTIEAEGETVALWVLEDGDLFSQLLVAVSEVVRGLFLADRLMGGPELESLAEMVLSGSIPESARERVEGDFEMFDVWIRQGLATGGRSWSDIKNRAADMVASIWASEPVLKGGYEEIIEEALIAVFARYEVPPVVAMAAMRTALGDNQALEDILGRGEAPDQGGEPGQGEASDRGGEPGRGEASDRGEEPGRGEAPGPREKPPLRFVHWDLEKKAWAEGLPECVLQLAADRFPDGLAGVGMIDTGWNSLEDLFRF